MNNPSGEVSPQYLKKQHFSKVETKLLRIPGHLCDRGLYQPRVSFSDEGMTDLIHSISTTGGNVMPVILRPKLANTRYEIIAGERRVRACMACDYDVLALVGDYDDDQAAAIALIENVQREDLNPLEEAEGYQTMITELGLRQQDVAELVGKSRSHVANLIRLLSLDLMVRDRVASGKLEVGHAKLLASLPKAKQRDVAKKISLNEWSVRKTEAYLRKLGEPLPPPPPTHNEDRDIARLEQELSEKTGSPVRIKVSKGGWKGELNIQFWSRDEFEHIESLLNMRKGGLSKEG